MNAHSNAAVLLALRQGSEDWALARAGMITASCFSDVMAKGQGIVRKKLMRKLLAERLIGKPIEGYRNAQMDRGHEQEPLARMAYEALTGNIVDEVGIIVHPRYDDIGCSPDGLVSDDGGCEIKSVIATIQLETIERGDIPPEHKAQAQGALWISGRQYWDFVSFCADMPPRYRVFHVRVEPDPEYIAQMSVEVLRFRNELTAALEYLMEKAA